MIMNELQVPYILLKLDVQAEKFEKINIEGENFQTVLESDFIYIIVDSIDKNVWIWNGKKANIRMKFIASQYASEVRDCYGIDYKICSVDEGDESEDFKAFLDSI